MQPEKFFSRLERNPILPILILLALLVVLAPDFEVPQASRAGHEAKRALPWFVLE